MCTEVFEHIPDPIAAVKEFARLLKPEGYLLLTAPFASPSHFTPYHFYSGFNRYWYERHLPEQGFEIIDLRANGNFFEYIAQEVLRLPSMASSSPIARVSSAAFKALSVPLLGILSLLSRYDRDSQVILCFGYHVLARRYRS